MLALNLAHEIVQGKKDAAAARKAYADGIAANKAGQPPVMAERLLFVFDGDTGDTDGAG
jgi:hypothetical protein